MSPRPSPRRLAAIVAIAAALGTTGGSRAEIDLPVDLELVLAVDVSGSIDGVEAKLQRQGYVSALTHPDIVAAIGRGFLGRIAVTYFEWAGAEHRRAVADWALIEDQASALAFAGALAAADIGSGRRTSISGAIAHALPLFEGNGYVGTRRVIDISGDGANNSGLLVDHARDVAVARGVTINGLPIINDRPNRFGFPQLEDLDRYYVHCVIGGAGAFIVVAHGFEAFARAIRRKLILEIAAGPGRFAAPTLRPHALLRYASAAGPAIGYARGCDIGERRLWEFLKGRNWVPF